MCIKIFGALETVRTPDRFSSSIFFFFWQQHFDPMQRNAQRNEPELTCAHTHTCVYTHDGTHTIRFDTCFVLLQMKQHINSSIFVARTA